MAPREHTALGDPDDPWEGPTKAQARKQVEAERLRGSVQRMHFHLITAGESAGRYSSHTHDDDPVGHIHEGVQVGYLRADGGYWEEKGPSLGTETPPALVPTFARGRERILSIPKPSPSELMVWRLRLFCGHVVERTAHRSHLSVDQAFTLSYACPECGLDPAAIVAGKPVGQPAEPKPKQKKTRSPARRGENLKAELAAAEVEVARLRRELKWAVANA